MPNMNDALILLAACLFMALIIERIMEILKSVYDYLEVRYGWYDFWNRRAKQLQARFEKRLLNDKGNKAKNLVLFLSSSLIREDHPGVEGVKVISANKVRNLMVKSVSKGLCITLGILVAYIVHLNMFKLVDSLGYCKECTNSGVIDVALRSWLGTLISGIAIGLGSEPTHKLISALESARKKRKEMAI